MTIEELHGILDELFPPGEAMPADGIGLQAGDPRARVRGILTALDADDEAVAAARRAGANVIVAHHPCWWKPPRTLPETQAVGAGLRAAIASGMAVLCAHTNADFAPGGLCDLMAHKLGLREVEPLRLEGKLRAGRIGSMEPEAWNRWLGRVRRAWPGNSRWAGVPPRRIARVAVCSGSGSDLLQDAADAGADALVTGDVRYHAARDAEFLGRRRARLARGGGFVLVDAGHHETERAFAGLAARLLVPRVGRIPVTPWNPRGPFRTA